jgi:transposase
MNRRFELTDQEWERLAPLVPAMTPRRGGRWRDHRQVLNGILFRVRTGVPWRDLPERYGPWETLYKRFARWQLDGTWARIEAALRTQADGLGSWTGTPRSTAAWCGPTSTPLGPAKGAGRRPRSAAASPRPVTGRGDHQAPHDLRRSRPEPGHSADAGQDADTRELVGLVDAVWVARPGGRGRPRMRPDHLTGDKAYSSRANRAALRARHIAHTIPERDDQKANRAGKGTRGGRPPAVDRTRYRQRNQVERLMNRRKQFRAVATRFDKLAVRYQATITIADIFIWLRARPDQPRGDPRNTP